MSKRPLYASSPPMTPLWPTRMKGILRDGRIQGVDDSLWRFMAVPLSPTADARTDTDRSAAAQPLLHALHGLANNTHVRFKRRRMDSSAYRTVRLMAVNVPHLFSPPRGNLCEQYLSAAFASQVTQGRVFLLGVKLDAGHTATIRDRIDSISETIKYGGVPLGDYDSDTKLVDSILRNAGLEAPSRHDIALANSWWNGGSNPDAPLVPHSDHLHVFNSPDALSEAEARNFENCGGWGRNAKNPILGQHSVSIASVEEFNLAGVPTVSDLALWMFQMLRTRALAVSVTGKLEPAPVTRNELRRQKKNNMDDIEEASKQGKMSRSEMQEQLDDLTEMEARYGSRHGSAHPTLTGASALVGFSGNFIDWTQINATQPLVTLVPMQDRQAGGFQDMLLASPSSNNPHVHDLPVHAMAYGGGSSLSMVGDEDGAALGFTEKDRQLALVTPYPVTTSDGLPIMLVAGATGSGKLVSLSTSMPAPGGTTTMGALKLGDEVLGRDGKPCRVTWLSDVEESPDAYRITFSDGQQIVADFDHQWVVSSFHDRNAARKTKHRAAIENWHRRQPIIDAIEHLAHDVGDSGREVTLNELFTLLVETVPQIPWNDPSGLYAALSMVDCPSRTEERRVARTYAATEVRKTDPVLLFPLQKTAELLLQRWAVSGGNAGRHARTMQNRAAACRALLAAAECQDSARAEPMPEIVRMLIGHGAVFPKTAAQESGHLRDYVRQRGLEPTPGRREVVVPVTGDAYTTIRPVRLYDLPVALKGLAQRLRQQYGPQPSLDAGERVMSTGEILAEGVRLTQGHANFAVRVTEAAALPAADLPLDPYVLGAWLGDGSTGCGTFTQGATEECTDDEGTTDQERLRDVLAAAGYPSRVAADNKTVRTRGLTTDLRAAGVLRRKHIPTTYLRASIPQRFAVLQGLMDTDGTVDVTGCCELSLSDRTLASDALELIRSLGIKASISWDRPAGYRDSEGELVECKDRHRIHFTTAQKVFRLPRKVARLRDEASMRETSTWIYIESIEPVAPTDEAYEPMRCISVDSPDATYLIGGFLPTHNTQVLLHLAYQFVESSKPLPVIFNDPKSGSDHSPVVEAAGGQTASLDELTASDGVYDPIRLSPSPAVAVELASSLLMTIDPWDEGKKYEVPLLQGLRYGVDHGAKCIMEALKIAADGIPDKVPRAMIDRIEDAVDASPMMRAVVGVNPSTRGLRVNDGLTYVKVGSSNLSLPPEGTPISQAPLVERTAAAVVRMMVFGSAMALQGRGGGVVMLDEAWVFLGAGKTEVERLGRLARSWGVLPILATQRVTDATNAGLQGYISRGVILSIKDPEEARAACELFKIDPTEERMARITASGSKAATVGTRTAPNWESLRTLYDPDTGKVIRGAVALYADLSDRVVPVEVTLPEEFLLLSDTRPAAVEKREALRKERLGKSR